MYKYVYTCKYIYIIHYVVTTIVVIPITSPFCLLIHYFQLCIFYRIPQKTYIYIHMYILIHKEKHINKIHFPSSISCYISNERSTSPCLCLQRFSCVFLSAGVKVTCFPYLSIQSVLVWTSQRRILIIRVYIYMYITLNIHIYIHIYIFKYIYVYIYIFKYIYVCIYIYMCDWKRVVYTQCVYIYMYIYICNIYIYIYIHENIYNMYIRNHIYVCIYMYLYIYIWYNYVYFIYIIIYRHEIYTVTVLL